MSPWTPLSLEVDYSIRKVPPPRILIDGETYESPADFTLTVDRERPGRVTLECAAPVPAETVTVVEHQGVPVAPVTFHGTTQAASDWQYPRFTGTAWLP